MQQVMKFMCHYQEPFTLEQIREEELLNADKLFNYDIFYVYLRRWIAVFVAIYLCPFF